jgi:hypothetical protein
MMWRRGFVRSARRQTEIGRSLLEAEDSCPNRNCSVPARESDSGPEPSGVDVPRYVRLFVDVRSFVDEHENFYWSLSREAIARG